MDGKEENNNILIEIIHPNQVYFIHPNLFFSHYLLNLDKYELNLTNLQAGFNELERQGEEFSVLFADIALNSTKLGLNAQ